MPKPNTKRKLVAPGVFQEPDGTFLAMSLTTNETFKTKAAAVKWLAAWLKPRPYERT